MKVWQYGVITLVMCALPGAAQDKPRFGIGVKASTLGAGIEAATAVTSRSNLRLGYNEFRYNQGFDKDGIHYDGALRMRSVELLYDQYIVGGFHISPGVLVYNGNRADATAHVPGGSQFTLGGTSLVSAAYDPVTGKARLVTGKAAPMLLMGFGNLLPRSTRRFAVNFEFGVVFQGTPQATLDMHGAVLTSSGRRESFNGTYLQPLLRAEEKKINDDILPFKYYPVVSLGFGYKF